MGKMKLQQLFENVIITETCVNSAYEIKIHCQHRVGYAYYGKQKHSLSKKEISKF